MHPFTVVVQEIKHDQARLSPWFPGDEAPSPASVWVPTSSVAHFVNDLRGKVYGKPSGNPAIDAVLRGDAEFLGKGDDGLAFRVGSSVVKVSTTVPYQPFNPWHRTPQQAIDRMEQQYNLAVRASQSFDGILPMDFVIHGDKAFLVKPYVEIPATLTRKQLDAVAASVEAAHKAGWVFVDDLQVGVWNDGLYHFDTGKLEYVGPDKADPDDWNSPAYGDVLSLKRLFSQYGQKYFTEKERESPVLAFREASAVRRGSTEQERKAQRSALMRARDALLSYAKNFPDADDLDEFASPEIVREEFERARQRLRET